MAFMADSTNKSTNNNVNYSCCCYEGGGGGGGEAEEQACLHRYFHWLIIGGALVVGMTTQIFDVPTRCCVFVRRRARTSVPR